MARFLAILWLMAAFSLVGWLFVNLDTAGWILVSLTVGLMTFELTRRPARRGGAVRRTQAHRSPDQPKG